MYCCCKSFLLSWSAFILFIIEGGFLYQLAVKNSLPYPSLQERGQGVRIKKQIVLCCELVLTDEIKMRENYFFN